MASAETRDPKLGREKPAAAALHTWKEYGPLGSHSAALRSSLRGLRQAPAHGISRAMKS